MLKCKVCNNTRLTSYIKFTSRELVECTKCGIIFDEDIDATRIDYVNESEYDKYWKNIDDYRNEIDDEYSSFVSSVKEIKPKGRILDIGCGRGDLLRHFDGSDYELLGIELSRKDVEIGTQEYGINIICDDFYRYPFSCEKFDIIILWGVIEHLNDLNGLMSKIEAIIAEDGLLIINTQIEDWVFIEPFRMLNRLFPKLGSYFGDFIYDREHLFFFRSRFLLDYLSSFKFFCINEKAVETLFFKYFYRYHSLPIRFISRFVSFTDNLMKSYRKKIFVLKRSEHDND